MFDRFAVVAAAYGLTARQQAVLAALVDTGGIREAANSLNVPYTSARNTVAELKAKLGVATVPMMIGLILELTPDSRQARFGQTRSHDLFSLSERQYAIARSISVAKSRAEIAASLRISEAVLDAEIKQVYLVLGVRSAGELVRVVASVGLGASPPQAPSDSEERGHYLPGWRIERNGRSIGYSDFGPPGAQPVLILHSTITSRAPPTRLVDALRKAGFRPFAIDRPGFGETDPGGSGNDPYVLASHDAAAVCHALGFSQVDVVARGAGQAAVRLAQLHPALIRRSVLVNPTPSIAFTTIDRGPLGAVKRAFGKRPWAVELMIRMLASYATPARMHDGMLRSFRESLPDYELVRSDPQFTADYMRAVRGFTQGIIAGYVAEQSAWAAGYEVEMLPRMVDWRILQARHFILHDPKQALAYWREKLPDTPICWVDEAGQMLAYSHPEHVVAVLSDR